MFKRVTGLWRGYRLLRRGIDELTGIRLALESIAVSLSSIEIAAVPRVGDVVPPTEVADPRVDSPYVETSQQAVLMDIELRLTQARGVPPTEDEVYLEFERRYGQAPTGQA
jgi:hypothetical protein